MFFSTKMFSLFLLTFLCPLVFGGDVISITKSTKDDLSKHPMALVKYYAPWCGHCKALAPHYEEAATELKKNKPPVPLFEVNCDEESDLCSEAGVQGYPTLKLYNFGEVSEDFDGPRTKEGIVDFMKVRAGPPATEITDESQLKEFIESDEYTCILQSKNTADIEEFEKLARKMRKFIKFAYAKDKLVDSSKETLVKLSRPKNLDTKLEDRHTVYDGAVNAASIEEWIDSNAVGLAGIRSPNLDRFFKKPLLTVYTNVNFDRDPSNVRYHRNRLIQIAKEVKPSLQLALADTSEFGSEIYELGLGDIDRSAVVIRAEDGKAYVMDGKFGIPEVKKFIKDFTAGSLEPFLKSEPIPEKQDEDVIKVVGKNFDEIVNDKTKDVLVEFYAPWCGHCNALKPKYAELAKKLKKEKDVVIAAIDATANAYPPKFSVRGYPTIYWVPKDSKDKPQPYEGGREVDDLLKFVAKSATVELSSYARDGTPKQEEL